MGQDRDAGSQREVLHNGKSKLRIMEKVILGQWTEGRGNSGKNSRGTQFVQRSKFPCETFFRVEERSNSKQIEEKR